MCIACIFFSHVFQSGCICIDIMSV